MYYELIDLEVCMKVLLVITGLGMGGAERVVVDLADGLVSRGHKVKIAYMTGPELVLPKSEEIEIVSLKMKSSKQIPTAYLKLRKLIKKFQPDIIHSHMFHANMLTRLIKLSISTSNLINTSHNTIEDGNIKARMLAFKISDSLADISTNVSNEAVTEYVRGGAVKSERMITVPNGIDVDRFNFDKVARARIREDLQLVNKKMLLAVGRFTPQKDYPNLLNALHLLRDSRQDFKVFIVGDGPLKSDIEQLINDLELTNIVELLGTREDVSSLMSATDVFVLSSAWEGFGLVVAEAMACERAVVATDCGGVAEVLGNTGKLVPLKNSEALANKIDEVLDMDSTEYTENGTIARERIIENYSLNINIDNYLKLYKILINNAL